MEEVIFVSLASARDRKRRRIGLAMAKSKGVKKSLDSYTVKGTHKVVKGERGIYDEAHFAFSDPDCMRGDESWMESPLLLFAVESCECRHYGFSSTLQDAEGVSLPIFFCIAGCLELL